MQTITTIAARYLLTLGAFLAIAFSSFSWVRPTYAAEINALTPLEIEQQLAELPAWALAADKLHRDFEFDSFIEAFGWMSSVAIASEALGHHPEWFNVYNRVSVDLTTHDAGGISTLDFELAQRM
ncbi:MAG: 4a-hydroxytetrahydrobiopterin dehydratase, partial [Cyanobacteria bacterium J06648_11]